MHLYLYMYSSIHNFIYSLADLERCKGAAVAEWLSSWLAEPEVRGSILRDWLSPASKSRYD